MNIDSNTNKIKQNKPLLHEAANVECTNSVEALLAFINNPT